MIGIYKITSPSDKIYVGQSWNIENRFKDYNKLNCKGQTKLYNSFIKYGIENHIFEVVIELPDGSQDDLDKCEQLHMNIYSNSNIELLNLKLGGSHGKHSEESKLKMSITKKGKRIGYKHSEETKQKMSKSHKGLNTWTKGIIWTSKKLRKPYSEETIKKLRNARLGVKVTEETKEKMRISALNRYKTKIK